MKISQIYNKILQLDFYVIWLLLKILSKFQNKYLSKK